jgi:hypothetical protein
MRDMLAHVLLVAAYVGTAALYRLGVALVASALL